MEVHGFNAEQFFWQSFCLLLSLQQVNLTFNVLKNEVDLYQILPEERLEERLVLFFIQALVLGV